MAYFSIITRNLTNFARKNLARLDGITDPILKGTAKNIDKAVENSTKVISQLSPEDAKLLEKELQGFYRHGFSQGEIKQLSRQIPDFAEKVELMADKKLVDTMLRRQGITKEQFSHITSRINADNKEAFIRILKDKDITNEQLSKIAHLVNDKNVPLLQQLLKEDKIDVEVLRVLTDGHLRADNIDVLRVISQKGNVSQQNILYIMDATTVENSDIAIKMLQKSETVNSGFDCILRKLQKPLKETEESLKIHEAQKKFFSELLDNPEFKLPEDELELYRLSKIIGAVTPDNMDVIQKAVLSKVKSYNLDNFTKGITKENKALASRILDLVEGEIQLPPMSSLKPELLEKYLDKVEKITDLSARKYYIEALEYLDDSNVEKILPLIKSSNPEEAKHASALITSLGRGIQNIDEIEPIITLIEKSGRQLPNQSVVNLSIFLRDIGPDELAFFQKVLKNQKISNFDIESCMDKYMRFARSCKQEVLNNAVNSYSQGKITKLELDKITNNIEQEVSKRLQTYSDFLDDLIKNEDLTSNEIMYILNQTNVKNLDILKKFAAGPKIKMIDSSAIKGTTKIEDIEAILSTDLPRHYQREILDVIKTSEKNAAKRLEIAQNLAQRNITPKNVASIIRSLDDDAMKYIDDILARTDLDDETLTFLIEQIKKGNGEIVKEILQNPKIKKEYLKNILRSNELVMPVYKSNPEQIITALEHKMPLVHGDLFAGDKLVSELLGEKRYSQVLKGLQEVKVKYGIEPKKELSLIMDTSNSSDDLFMILKDDYVTYKFNKKSGKLVSVQTKDITINVRTNTRVSDIVATEGKIKVGDEKLAEVPYHIETEQVSKKGILRTVYTESGIKGQYDIYHTKPDGTRIKVGRAQVTPNGAQHVSRTLSSVNGTKTAFSYRKDVKGNTYLHSVIKNKSGEVISDVTRKRIVISKNHFITTCNDQAFDIVFTNDKVVVTRLDAMGKKTKETVEYAIRDIPVEKADEIAKEIMNFGDDEVYKVAEVFKKHGIEPRTLDRRCVEMLKELPGDEWFAMNKSAEFVMPQTIDDINAFYAGNSIFMGKQHMRNLGVYCHELGHAKFHTLGLANDPELLKIYNAEKELYTSTFPKSRVESIDYFLEGNKNDLRGLNEASAETNLITDTIQSWDQIQDRTIFYEQYFPETIAYIRKRYAELV